MLSKKLKVITASLLVSVASVAFAHDSPLVDHVLKAKQTMELMQPIQAEPVPAAKAESWLFGAALVIHVEKRPESNEFQVYGLDDFAHVSPPTIPDRQSKWLFGKTFTAKIGAGSGDYIATLIRGPPSKVTAA